MARRIPLKTFGHHPDEAKQQMDAKVSAGEVGAGDAQQLLIRQHRADPWFDYASELTELVANPTAGRGNSGSDIRMINKIVGFIDQAKAAGIDCIILEEPEYAFLANRVANFANWAPISPALNRLIERLLDDVAGAETVDLNGQQHKAA